MATVYVRVVNVNGFVVFSGKREKKDFIFGEKTIFKGSTRKIFEKVPTFTSMLD